MKRCIFKFLWIVLVWSPTILKAAPARSLTDSLPPSARQYPGLVNRLHRRFYASVSLYRFLYTHYWLVDSGAKAPIILKKPALFLFPFITYAQETKLKFGFGGFYAFFTSPDDTITRVSSQTVTLYYTQLHQFDLELNPDLWTRGNAYHFTGTFAYQNLPFQYYGVGNDTRDRNKVLLTATSLYLDLEAERQISKQFRAGITAVYAHYDFAQRSVGGGNAFFTGVTVVFDTRDRLNYSTKGTFFYSNFSYAPSALSTFHPLTQTKITDANFIGIGKKGTLGFNGVYKNINGSNVPFYLLEQLGGSNIMRGYYTGRFRDKNLIALQSEFRYRLIPRVVFAGFVGTGTVFGNSAFSWSKLLPDWGGGFRYVIDLTSGLDVRLDYGVGNKLSREERSSGFYLSLGEAF